MIDADSGTGLSGSGKRLRTVNRTLSRLRDADAMIETQRTLQHRHPDLFSEHVYKVRKGARRWEPTHRGFDALGPGLRKTHRRAGQTLALARSEQSPETFHEWRARMEAKGSHPAA